MVVQNLRFPSAEWCAAYGDVSAEPAIGITEDMGVVIDLHQGTCRGCTLTLRAAAEKAAFVIVAS
jgi:hypothetical protein